MWHLCQYMSIPEIQSENVNFGFIARGKWNRVCFGSATLPRPFWARNEEARACLELTPLGCANGPGHTAHQRADLTPSLLRPVSRRWRKRKRTETSQNYKVFQHLHVWAWASLTQKKGWVSRWTSASETMLRQPSTINYASVSMLLKPCFRNYILGNHVLATKRKLCCRKRRRLSATSKTTQTTWKINVTPRAQLLERQGCKLRTTIACRALGGGGLKHDLESWWELMEGQSWIEEHHCAQGFGGTFKKWLGIVMRTHGRTKLNWGTPLRAGLWGEV